MDVPVARRARLRALLVPAVWSLMGWALALESALAVDAWPVVAGGLALVVLACTGVGERWTARVLLRGRVPRLHQRHTLAPVAKVLLDHGVVVDGLLLLVGPGPGVGAMAVGERTLVVTRGLVEAVRSGRLAPVTAASVIAHELGIVRAGLTRRSQAWAVFLLPWSALVGFLALLWGIVTVFVPAWVLGACMVISAGVGLWLGATEHPVHLASTLVMAVVAWTWWSSSVWHRVRAQVGDDHLVNVGLAGSFADYLGATGSDDATLDRIVRLQQQDSWHPGRSGDGTRPREQTPAQWHGASSRTWLPR
ncbi:hypothetical protein [Ornithinimicrobium kibberense]|uniref:Zn-dependent protease with chaperone function n=1 Tax=Ornithinimicrobium kibberense TaxID=282060 RepID=A0ABV5V6S4_9MICO|nr:hypothetical protein [Ornithinimicrobium kibberense]